MPPKIYPKLKLNGTGSKISSINTRRKQKRRRRLFPHRRNKIAIPVLNLTLTALRAKVSRLKLRKTWRTTSKKEDVEEIKSMNMR